MSVTMNRQEIPNNTAEQVTDYVRDAVALVELLEVPDDLRVPAFTEAVRLFAAKNVIVEQTPTHLGILGMPRQ
jgi:hypothetical protein